jgi:hypothetical protein
MTGFSESPEYRRRVASEVTVAVLYTLLLGRAPTASEFAVRVAQVDAGVYTSTSLADDLRRRPEYAARFGIT